MCLPLPGTGVCVPQGVCPFCGGAPLGSVSHALWISGSTFVTAMIAGFRHKIKTIWNFKIKPLLSFIGVTL